MAWVPACIVCLLLIKANIDTNNHVVDNAAVIKESNDDEFCGLF